jgi:hypothetical protein
MKNTISSRGRAVAPTLFPILGLLAGCQGDPQSLDEPDEVSVVQLPVGLDPDPSHDDAYGWDFTDQRWFLERGYPNPWERDARFGIVDLGTPDPSALRTDWELCGPTPSRTTTSSTSTSTGPCGTRSRVSSPGATRSSAPAPAAALTPSASSTARTGPSAPARTGYGSPTCRSPRSTRGRGPPSRAAPVSLAGGAGGVRAATSWRSRRPCSSRRSSWPRRPRRRR